MTSTSPPSEPRRHWTEHVGTGLTLGYLLLIAIGMFHTWVRYYRFRINIVSFAEPSDFLLAPFQDPLVMVATVVPVLVMSWYLRTSERYGERLRVRRREAGKAIAWWETKPERVDAMKARMKWMRLVIILLWVVASALWYERKATDALMMGNGTQVSVETTDGKVESGTSSRPLILIGTTGKYAFLFRTDDWKAEILPIENIIRIVPSGVALGVNSVRSRFLRRMDSTATRGVR